MNRLTDYTVGRLVADTLEENGVHSVFGIVSVHNMPIMDAIAANKSIRMIMTRGETGAAHMADGYSRATGEIGVVISSTGPGAANAVPGLVEALYAGTPLLHITGQTPTAYLGKNVGAVHDLPSQGDMLKSASKAVYRINTLEQAESIIRQAVQAAISQPTGPVSLEIPIDLQAAHIRPPSDLSALKVQPRQIAPAKPADLAKLIAAVKAARRPMLWVGAGANEAADPLLKLMEMGFGAVSSWSGRGIISDSLKGNLGALNGAGLTDVQDLYRSVDLMLIAGSRLRGQETDNQQVPLPENLIRIDIDQDANGRGYGNKLFIHGDCQSILSELAAAVEGTLSIDPNFAKDLEKTKEAAIRYQTATLGPYKDFPAILRSTVPENALWIRDITMSNSTWGHKLFPLNDKTANIYPVSAGIGQGLQLGIGAAVGASERPAVLLTGDGGFYFNMAELWTAVQERLDMLIIVMNDQGYGAIRNIQNLVCAGRHNYDALTGPDFEQLAKLAGLKFWRVRSTEDFSVAARQAISETGLRMIEVDMVSIGALPMYHPYQPKQNTKQ